MQAGRASQIEMAMRRALPATSDADGRFRLKSVRGGRHRLVVGAGNLLASGASTHAVAEREVEVAGAATTDAGVIRLVAAARIGGTVRGSDGRPLSGATVFLRESESGKFLEEWTSTTSDAGGAFEYGGVPEGRYDVVCRGPGHALATVSGITARAGEVARADLRLDVGTEVFADIGAIEFDRLMDLEVEVNGPAGRIPLTLFGLSDLQDLMAQPWKPDVVRLGRFAPGDYRVTARLGDRHFEKTFHLAGEPELHVPLSLE